MRPIHILLIIIAIAATAHAQVLVTGITSIDGVGRATLKESVNGKESDWVAVGDTFCEYRVVDIKLKDSVVVLLKEGKEISVSLRKTNVQMGKPEEGTLENLGEEELHARGFHKMGPGDTGMRIAKAMGVSIADLQRWNPGVNWARLKIGQVVRIKGPGDEASQSSTAATTPAAPVTQQ
jgi:hypothetical protein